MNEKDLVLHANDYIKQMAKGINPLTQEPIAESDILNNVKISRCLFFVSEILDKYVEMDKGSSSIRKKTPKTKFYATYDDLKDFEYFKELTYLSYIARRINETFNKEDMKKLPARAISDWLVSKGFLVSYTREDGVTSKKPTRFGEELGITPELREGARGQYIINSYNVNAQKFIIENIEDISKSIQ